MLCVASTTRLLPCRMRGVNFVIVKSPGDRVNGPGVWPNQLRWLDVSDRTCSFPGCGKNLYAKGFCKGHYQQTIDGRKLKPLRPKRNFQDVVFRNNEGNKHCVRCDEWLPEDYFGEKEGHADGLYMWCRRCQADDRKGLPITRRWELMELQEGGCQGCGFVFSIHGGKGNTYYIDHDHRCCPGNTGNCGNCIRGLLCGSCNKSDVLAS